MRRAAVLGAVGVGGRGLWRDVVLKIPGFLLRTCEPFLCMWLPHMALSQLSGEIRFREKTSNHTILDLRRESTVETTHARCRHHAFTPFPAELCSLGSIPPSRPHESQWRLYPITPGRVER